MVGRLAQGWESDHGCQLCEESKCQEAVQVFREPVITPSGLSYEQSALQEHLSKVSAPLLFSTPSSA